jgi:hypothetical protein
MEMRTQPLNRVSIVGRALMQNIDVDQHEMAKQPVRLRLARRAVAIAENFEHRLQCVALIGVGGSRLEMAQESIQRRTRASPLTDGSERAS